MNKRKKKKVKKVNETEKSHLKAIWRGKNRIRKKERNKQTKNKGRKKENFPKNKRNE